MRTAVYFDLETGGVEPHYPDIQLAAVAVDEDTWRELGSFEAKIAFDPAAADPAALAMNHWNEAAWATAPKPAVVVAEFARFLKNYLSLQMISKKGHLYKVAKLVGHNAASFDGPRLQRLFKAHDAFLPADPRVRCTCQRAMWWFDEHGGAPHDFKLATLARHFDIPVEETHEALADVRLCVKLARVIKHAVCSRVAA